MFYSSESIFFKRISSLLALTIITVLAAIVGAIIIHQSKKLADLQRPLPFLIATSTLQYLE